MPSPMGSGHPSLEGELIVAVISDSAARRLKGACDRSVGAFLILFLSPVMLAIALICLAVQGRPVLYSQTRVGRDGREFTVLKFRSMKVHRFAALELGQIAGGHPLVTRWGSFMRRMKLDELPQLFSIVDGSMSIVGPRPSLPELTEQYSSWERRRLECTPGLTGWAQVNGNITVPWQERISLDVWYIDHWSLWLDLKILLRTPLAIISGERPRPEAVEEALAYEACRRRRGA